MIEYEERIAPLDVTAQNEREREALAPVTPRSGRPPMNIFLTLARHDVLMKAWLPFADSLLGGGELPARDREILILRTARNTGATYEWAHHVPSATRAGVDEAVISALRDDLAVGSLSESDELLVRAADELHVDSLIASSTWSSLRDRYTTEQLIEIPMLVGHYHMIAQTLNSLGVQLEDGFIGL